jgi:Zn-finger nucleic acid-binding protein
MSKIKIKSQSLADRCEICHQTDCFDAEKNFCSRCQATDTQARIITPAILRPCPRCQGQLSTRMIGTGLLGQCSRCNGLWIDKPYFDKLMIDPQEQAAAIALEQTATASALDGGFVQYISCLNCAQMMTRSNYDRSSGIIIDLCREHGVWLDYGELRALIEYSRNRKSNETEQKARLQQTVSTVAINLVENSQPDKTTAKPDINVVEIMRAMSIFIFLLLLMFSFCGKK